KRGSGNPARIMYLSPAPVRRTVNGGSPVTALFCERTLVILGTGSLVCDALRVFSNQNSDTPTR
ncbi:MAG: hypothetical protein NT023_16100, partial [Armatimonadetes bacterium]|nr:hypothetical protein [Armatimonadota bacterium]